MEYGAKVCKPPTFSHARLETMNLEIMHWLLFRGNNPRIWGGRALRPWFQFLVDLLRSRDTISFIKLEGILSHLLLHGVDPHELFRNPQGQGKSATATDGITWFQDLRERKCRASDVPLSKGKKAHRGGDVESLSDAVKRTTLLWEAITTPEGRRHLSHSPHGKLL